MWAGFNHITIKADISSLLGESYYADVIPSYSHALLDYTLGSFPINLTYVDFFWSFEYMNQKSLFLIMFFSS